QGVAGLRKIHGRAPCLLHYNQVGARLGTATIDRTTCAVGATLECRAELRALSECDRSTHTDSAGRFVALSNQVSPTLSIQLRGNQGLIACSTFAARPRSSTTLDLLLPVRITDRRGLADQCGSQDGCADNPKRKIRQDSFDPSPPVDASSAG